MEIPLIPPGGSVVVRLEVPDGYWRDADYFIQRRFDDLVWSNLRWRGVRRRRMQRQAFDDLLRMFGAWTRGVGFRWV